MNVSEHQSRAPSERGIRSFSFARLISPITVSSFLTQYYGQQELIINREEPAFYSQILSPDILDTLLLSSVPTRKQVLVVNAANDISDEQYSYADGAVDSAALHKLFQEGATISYRNMENCFEPVFAICRSVEQVLSCPIQANFYFTPATAQGLHTHHDTHDVFVLQVSGSKEWRTYDPRIRTPLRGQSFYWEVNELPGTPVHSFLLRAGDLFYCPRGVPHNAVATDEPSLHITLGVLARTWTDVMIEALAELALRDPEFRQALPAGYATTQDLNLEAITTKFRMLANKFVTDGNPLTVLSRFADEFVGTRRQYLPDQACYVKLSEQLTADSLVGSRPGLLYRITPRSDDVLVVSPRREMKFPLSVLPALRFAVHNSHFKITDLPGELHEHEKIILVKRLILEGLLVVL